MKVGVIGLGKVGVCMASVYAKHGFDVVGVDKNEETILQIQKGRCPVEAIEEKGLEKLLQTVPLKVSSDYGILKGCEIIMVIVPTPSRSDGRYDNSYVLSALRSLCEAVEAEAVRPVIVVKSTVAPGSCEDEFIPLLREIGEGIGLCYSAEMIGLGNVVYGLEYPEELLVGEQDVRSGDKLEKFFCMLFAGRKMPALRRMSLWNAELSKLALNVFLVTKISMANTIARLCDQSPTGNVDDVLGFVGGDSRIGGSTMLSGLGYGGTCYPRDCRALISVAGGIGVDIPKAVDGINLSQIDYIYNAIKPLPKTVSILGVTYKPEIQLVDESRVVLMIDRMIKEGAVVRLHDPKGLPEVQKILGDAVYYAATIEDCLYGSELAIVGMAWECYRNMDIGLIKKNMKKAVVYDCWRIWNAEQMHKYGIEYHAFGICD